MSRNVDRFRKDGGNRHITHTPLRTPEMPPTGAGMLIALSLGVILAALGGALLFAKTAKGTKTERELPLVETIRAGQTP